MQTKSPTQSQTDPSNGTSELTQAEQDCLETIREHDQVEKVVEYDDHTQLRGAMVVVDWATSTHMENGTRYIEDKDYDGHIRNVTQFLDSLDGIRTTRTSNNGLTRYTFHITFTDEI